MHLNSSSIGQRAKEEVEEFLVGRDIDVKEVICAYIKKVEEYAFLEAEVNALRAKHKSIEEGMQNLLSKVEAS